MAIITPSALLAQAQVIKDEINAGANTKTRVGDMIIDFIESVYDTIQNLNIGGGDLSETDIDSLAKLNAIVADATLVSVTLANLTTTEKGSLEGAINELKTTVDNLDASSIGLGNVNNTSDNDKPVSTAQATADNLRLLKSANLSDLSSVNASNNNLLENNTTGSVTHTVDGADRAISFNGVRKFTLTLDNNIDELSFTNLPDSSEFIPAVLTINQNATVGYNIASILNLENTDDVFPDMSYDPGTTSIFYIYKTTTGVRVIGFGNV